MYTNSDVTLYLYRKEKETEWYERHAVNEVFWDDVRQANYSKTGLVNTDSVLLVIPLSGMGGEPILFTPGKDLAVKGIIDFEFDHTDEKTISESLRRLKERYHPVTVMSVDEKLYGSPCMQHIELSCK
ncbi:MAG: hypothetical protein J6B85_05990 [Lachnospiraceae bacterium]|nr:hypothetical protein [Lachnospiraceae bacterium]